MQDFLKRRNLYEKSYADSIWKSIYIESLLSQIKPHYNNRQLKTKHVLAHHLNIR